MVLNGNATVAACAATPAWSDGKATRTMLPSQVMMVVLFMIASRGISGMKMRLSLIVFVRLVVQRDDRVCVVCREVIDDNDKIMNERGNDKISHF